MAAYAHLKIVFTEDEKCHNLMGWLNFLLHFYVYFQIPKMLIIVTKSDATKYTPGWFTLFKHSETDEGI